MFNDVSETLERVFHIDEILIEPFGAEQEVTIDVTGRQGPKTFYFVTNSSGRSDDLLHYNVGVTSKSEFVEAITNRDETLLAIPFLMSGQTTIQAIESLNGISSELEVQLFRRVARFDIENNPDVTNFSVKKILISNANQRTFVFSDAMNKYHKTIEKGNYAPIVITPLDPLFPNRLDSVFYLYPTLLGNGNGKTNIALEGTFNGQTKVYNLNLPTDVQVKPNHRYILKIEKVDINNIELSFKTEDWTKDMDLEVGNVVFSEIDYSVVEGLGLSMEINRFDVTHITDRFKLSFTALSYQSDATDVNVEYTIGSEASLPGYTWNVTESKLVYSTNTYYLQIFEIEVPVYIGKKDDFWVHFTIANKNNAEQKKTFSIMCMI